MEVTASCFVAKDGAVVIGGKSFDENMRSRCLEYQFNLERRYISRVVMPSQDKFLAELFHYLKAWRFFHDCFGTPEKLIKFVKTAYWGKAELATLLDPSVRQMFLKVCGILEKEVTTKCESRGDPCLESGCSFEGTDEVCLNAVLLSEEEYLRVCVDIWISKFEKPENRIPTWRS